MCQVCLLLLPILFFRPTSKMIAEAISYVHSGGRWIPSVVLWVVWRIWMFTIRPRLHASRDEVDVLPYNIPLVGHAISLFMDPVGLYEYADAYFGHTRKPYTIHTVGEKIVVVTDPQRVAEIWKNNDTYSSDPFIDALYRTFGNVSNAGSRILWQKKSDGFSLHPNPNPKKQSLVHICHDLLLAQLLSPGPARELTRKALSIVEDATRYDTIFPPSAEISQTADGAKVVSLHRWCRDILITAQMSLFFGPLLHEIEPNAASLLDAWDANSWMLAYQYPSILSRAATVPREKLVIALKAYLNTPKGERQTAVPILGQLENEMKYAGLSNEDCARVLMITLWEINTNVQMTAFWMLAHILPDPSLIATIRKELAPAMKVITDTETTATEPHLSDIFRTQLLESSNCPTLNSLYAEVLRVYTTSAPIRVTTRPAPVGDGKVVPVHTKILLPQRMLLVAREVFGPDADRVDPYRFVKQEELLGHESYQPFGGGESTTVAQSSGRTAGRYVVLAFVVLVLWRFDVDMVPEGKMAGDGKTAGMCVPRSGLKKPSLGVSRQVDGADVIVEVRRRSETGK